MSTPNETSPWQRSGEPASLGDPHGLVTLVEGQAFCVCSRTGDIGIGSPQGIFFADTRLISVADLRIDGLPLEPLAVARLAGFAADFVARTRPAMGTDRPLLVVRRRRLGVVLREDIEVRNPRPDPVRCWVTLTVDTDFADVFAVKESRVAPRGTQAVEVHPSSLLFSWQDGSVRRRVEVAFSGDDVAIAEDGATWHLTIPAHGMAVVTWDVDTAFGDRWFGSPPGSGLVDTSEPGERSASWHATTPRLTTDHSGLGVAFARAIEDVGALRLFDPHRRRRPVIAAGAPWFMTLFGRDSLLTAYMALPVDPSLALGVLETLAELQGVRVDPHTEEEPGRIMHETRFLDSDDVSFGSGSVYYGTVDATPLFVAVLAELSRWGLPEPMVRALLPHADRALQWISEFGDRDGDGYVEYLKRSPHGLDNQGWKDSWDGIRFHDGRVARAPLALCEVQGYVYAAYVGRADLAERLGDDATAARWRTKASDLRRRFNEDFWIDDLGWLAVGLGPEKERVDSLASNMGHCLWSGVLDDERADIVRRRLTTPPMWTGWGLRTLAADEPAFDPASYHCGSVWPHDNALAVAGLARYGFHDEAHQVMAGLLDAAGHWGGRLPELFCGLDRADVTAPVPFPTSCSPQAWAAASPLLFVRVLLGLSPDVPRGRCTVDPHLPEHITELHAEGVRLWDTRVDVTVDRSGVEVLLPDGLDQHGSVVAERDV